jgi:ADP-heptose:LPS heptosyltransferase
MLSGVLKLVHDRFPERKFNLSVRSSYLPILKEHPAITSIGHPPKNALVVGTDYWAKEDLGPGNQRAFQILARMFGLETPVDEILFFPGSMTLHPLFESTIPWGEKNILISPASNSPRKMMNHDLWEKVVSLLVDDGYFVIQTGRLGERKIKKTYSLYRLYKSSGYHFPCG